MSFQEMCTPDTGSSHTLINHDVAARHGLAYDPNHNAILKNASGTNMEITGITKITLQIGKHKSSRTAIIVRNLNHKILIGWKSCIELALIPTNFPQQMRTDGKPIIVPDNCTNKECNETYSMSTASRNSLTPKEIAVALTKEFRSVLSDELSTKPMKARPMPIHIKTVYKPYRTTVARTIPKRYEAPAKTAIKELIKRGVIIPVTEPTEWCSPAFFVSKPDGKRVRLVTDFTRLNQFVERAVHPFPSSEEIVRAIPHTAKFFAKLDAVHGYFQLALDEESSYKTTFLLPSGRYRYLRAPMGLNASSDEWCRNSDVVIEGLNYAKKIVDDILVWAPDLPTLHTRLRTILRKCKEYNITISRSKFEISRSIIFAGYKVSDTGIGPDPQRTRAIRDFPRPNNIHDLRSFLGLANTLGHFVPDLVHMTAEIRKLTKAKHAYIWLDEHEREFEAAKELLAKEMLVQAFNPEWTTSLYTDASRLYGMGYALIQNDPNDVNKISMVTCGSKSLTDTQKRYSTVELECLAILVGIKKCDCYLRGLKNFQVFTDHKPLLGVFDKETYALENQRLMRMREKLTQYTFQVNYIPGKNNTIADALSRAPVFPAEEEDLQTMSTAATLTIEHDEEFHCMSAELDNMVSTAENNYKAIVAALRNSDKNPPNIPQYQQLKRVWHRLSLSDEKEDLIMYDNTRIFVPCNSINKIVKLLHKGHPGITKSRELARQLYFWPGMNNDISQVVENCEACQEIRPQTQHFPATATPPSTVSTTPMENVGTDLFSHAGKDYLIMVDRCSGYPCCAKLDRTNTAAIVRQL